MQRWGTLDEFRGLAMVFLTIFFPLSFFDSVTTWLKHSPGNSIYLADIGAPVFFFAIGISYFISFEKRRRTMSNRKLITSFLVRYSLFMIIGYLAEIVLGGGGFGFRWSVLEAIGLGGVLVLPFMYTSYKIRLASAIAIPLVWQFFLSAGHQNYALMYGFGGPWAVPAWSSIILFGSALSEIRSKTKEDLFLPMLVAVAVLMSIVGKNAANFFPISKHLVSLPYLALSTAVSVFFFAVFVAKETVGGPSFRFLSMVGRNSFAIYVVAGVESLFVESVFPASLAIGWVVVVTAAASLFCFLLAWVLDKKKIYIKI